MQIDALKAIFAYFIALVLIVGGLLFLYLSRLDDPEASNTATLIPLVAGFVGIAVTWVFSRETQTQTARQVERGYNNSQPTITTTEGPPQTTTITPPVPDPDEGT
jgi:hypothetical protein